MVAMTEVFPVYWPAVIFVPRQYCNTDGLYYYGIPAGVLELLAHGCTSVDVF